MSKKRDNDTRHAERILSALNNVERIRKDACGEFHRYGETAHNLWQMAQGMEESIIRENNLPNIDEILMQIFNRAEECFGNIGNGYCTNSYMRSAYALWEICVIVKRSVTPMLDVLLDLISADGYKWEYLPECCPTKAMLEPSRGTAAKQEGGEE